MYTILGFFWPFLFCCIFFLPCQENNILISGFVKLLHFAVRMCMLQAMTFLLLGANELVIIMQKVGT